MAPAVWRYPLVFGFLLLTCSTAAPQSPRGFEGMWSDPPVTPEDTFCIAVCTDAGIQRLNALLDDPANDARTFNQLSSDAAAYQQERYIRPRLSPLALRTFPLDLAKDPGLLRCEPWGLARQVFARHQLQITRQGSDRLVLRYGEWDATRIVYLDGRTRPANQPPTQMGHSVGRYEGDTLVIETTGVSPNWTSYLAEHSDRLRMVERYTRAKDGIRLLLSATIEDPWSLREPVTLKKVWRWAPGAEIAPYTDCERPGGLVKGAN